MTVTLVVWDFDGTLIDSRPQIVAGMDHALAQMGLSESVKAEWLKYVGLPVEHGIQRTFGPLGYTLEAVLPIYRSFNWTAHEHLLQPFPGMSALVHELQARGVKQAIASSKRTVAISRQIALFGWTECFDPVITPDQVAEGKPHPESLVQVLAHHGCSPEAAVMIGDTPFDLEMAERAGVPSIAVGHGFYDQAALEAWKPRAYAPDVQALRDILLAMVTP